MRKPATIMLITSLVTTLTVIGIGSDAKGHVGHTVTVNNVTASEGAGAATFTLTVTPAPEAGETVKVDVATANGSAVGVANCPAAPGNASADYGTVAKTTITFGPGESTKQRSVPICQDAAAEGDETFFLNLTDAAFTCEAPCSASTASIGDFQGLATITDDESAPALQITDRSAAEGPVGSSTFAFDVGLSSATNKIVTVQYATANGTASASAGSDYTAKTGTLTFPANSTSAQTINVAVTGDTTSELDETFFVDLSSPTNATIGDPRGIGTILNDDTPAAGNNAFNIADVARNEGNSGNAPATPFTFTVTLGRAPLAGQTATLNYHVSEGSASAGEDYVFTNGTLAFGANETAKTITVPVIGDAAPEGNETFDVNLSGANCTTSTAPCDDPGISDPEGRGTINNDDTAPPGPGPTPISATLKVGGYFQARVTAEAPCQAGRLVKIKQSVPGTDKVRASGTTGADGVYKQAVRPKKRGKFYAQVYDTRKSGASGEVLCKGGKSPVRTLPA